MGWGVSDPEFLFDHISLRSICMMETLATLEHFYNSYKGEKI
jgi:hypothetical protein